MGKTMSIWDQDLNEQHVDALIVAVQEVRAKRAVDDSTDRCGNCMHVWKSDLGIHRGLIVCAHFNPESRRGQPVDLYDPPCPSYGRSIHKEPWLCGSRE